MYLWIKVKYSISTWLQCSVWGLLPKTGYEHAPMRERTTAAQKLFNHSLPPSLNCLDRSWSVEHTCFVLCSALFESILGRYTLCTERGGDLRISERWRVVLLMQTDQRWQANCDQRENTPEARTQSSLHSCSVRLLYKETTHTLYSVWQCGGIRGATLQQEDSGWSLYVGRHPPCLSVSEQDTSALWGRLTQLTWTAGVYS